MSAMPPFRVEYRCLYRPGLWRWDGAEFNSWDEVSAEAARVIGTGRQVRIVDAWDRQLWPQ